MSHAFGDAISPYLIGAIADWVKAYISNDIPPDTTANYDSTANASISKHAELSLDTSSIEVNKYWLLLILCFWLDLHLIYLLHIILNVIIVILFRNIHLPGSTQSLEAFNMHFSSAASFKQLAVLFS